MYRTITFDHQISFSAEEVCDVFSELMLPPKLKVQQLTSTQHFPKQILSRGLSLAQLARKVALTGNSVTTAILTLFPHVTSCPVSRAHVSIGAFRS
jgi:hypothetical protein